MSDYSLCASTFFYLLLCLRNGGISGRSPSQAACFRAFINVVDPQAVSCFKESGDLEALKPHASHLRNAKPDGKTNVYMNFGNGLTVDEFERKLTNSPDIIFDAIDHYFEKYTKNTSYVKEWLVKQLLALIDADDHVAKNKFMVSSQCVPNYKNEVMQEKSFNFYYFVAGIWLYVYSYNPDFSLGQSTIEIWKSKSGETDLMGLNGKFSDIQIAFDRSLRKETLAENKATAESGCAKVNGDTSILKSTTTEALNRVYGAARILADHQCYLTGVYDSVSNFKDSANYLYSKTEKYIKRVKDDYSSCFTFRNRVKTPFYDIYVCSDIKKSIVTPISFRIQLQLFPKDEEKISNIEFDQFSSNQIMIVGSGGYGKSMLMRHLLLSCIKKCPSVVPVFVMLGKFKPESEDGIVDLIFDEMNILGNDIKLSEILELLSSGSMVLFLDGFDEIPQEHRDKFVETLNRMIRKYNKATYVMSSRNNPHLEKTDGFIKYHIQPLTEEQAITMIGKLKWATEELKENIVSDIKSNRFRLNAEEKKTFLGNPLFLSIVVATYQYTHNIQTKRYMFYDDAYSVMYKEHDAVKGLTRSYDTNLDEDEFKLRFGEFCALAFSEGESQFEKDKFDDYFHQVIEVNNMTVSVEDFSEDITGKLCLMYVEGGVYHWVHRSFQEYLAAYFFSQQVDAYFEAITDTFILLDENLHDDETLPMMFGLNPSKTEMSLIMPYLRKVVLGFCDEHDDDEELYMQCYHDFLEVFYPKIEFSTFDMDSERRLTDYAVYNFIATQYGLTQEVTEADFPNVDLDELIGAEKFYSRDTGRKTESGSAIWEVLKFEELSEKQQRSIEECVESGEVDYEGVNVEIEFDYIFGTGRKCNQDLIKCIDSKDFALRKEFDAVLKLVQNLKKKYMPKKKGSFLSKFH